MSMLQNQCSAAQWAAINKYIKLMQTLNKSVNLVSRQDIAHLMEHHVAPSFAFKILERIQPGEYILDIGSGGGFPGIINALLFPNTEFLLVDSTQKKVKALERIIAELNLPNINTVWTRVENMNTAEYEHVFDRTTSRAVASLDKLIQWSLPLLKPLGTVEAMKGGNISAEIETITPAFNVMIQQFPEKYRINPKLEDLKIVTVTV